MTTARVKCCELVKLAYSYERNCSRWASITREGKGYCWQHDPVMVKNRRAIAMVQRWQAEGNVEEQTRSLEAFQEGLAEDRTLSRGTAIKLVEAAEWVIKATDKIQIPSDEYLLLTLTVKAAKRELGMQ